MKLRQSRTEANSETWPRVLKLGRHEVTIYRRARNSGNYKGQFVYEVKNYVGGKRRLDSFSMEEAAMERAKGLLQQTAKGEDAAARLTTTEAAQFISASQALEPHLKRLNLTLGTAADLLARCLTLVDTGSNLIEAAESFARRTRKITAKPVREAVTEFLAYKDKTAKARYREDLRSRLNIFAESFGTKGTDRVTTSDLSEWINSLTLQSDDKKPLGARTYNHFIRVIHTFFVFAIEKGYSEENPAAGLKTRKVADKTPEVFTPEEITLLLSHAKDDFLPALAIGAFAGIRSAEIERLEWKDVNLAERYIAVTAEKAKTGSRRTVPITDNLAAWLAPYANRTGKVWAGTHEAFYIAQESTAKAAGVAWKQNALRHSFASYRLVTAGREAGIVAGEMGNSPAMVSKHYVDLVKPSEAARWFNVFPPSKQQGEVLPVKFAAA